LGISALVFSGVGQAGAGAVNDFNPQAAPRLGGFFGVSGGGTAQTRQNIPRQPGSCLAPTAGAIVHAAIALEGKERLDLVDDLATGAARIEHLIEKAKEGAADGVNPLAAVGAFVGLGQDPWRQQRAEELIEVGEALLAQVLDARPQGGQPGAKGREERSVHLHSIITVPPLDTQVKMAP